MKKILFITLIFSALAFKTQAQTHLQRESFSDTDFVKHVGKKVTMCGRVTSYKIFSDSLSMLNMNGEFPNQQYTIVVSGKEVVLNFDDIKGKQICVTGDKSVYLNKPEIMIYHINQLTFK
jgi:hypothetical protein